MLLFQPPARQVPRTIENTREADETVCKPDDEEVRSRFRNIVRLSCFSLELRKSFD